MFDWEDLRHFSVFAQEGVFVRVYTMSVSSLLLKGFVPAIAAGFLLPALQGAV
ncbi:hypothetical protein D8I24_3964 (plasmid) [Cupriavidus necator H850]|nr:hypothetical protein D8I24_3964 [Cupriavidus necator H850]